MRIGLVIDRLHPQRGGAERWTSQLATWLVRRGHEVHVVARDVAKVLVHEGVQPHAIDRARTRFDAASAAEQIIKKLNLDVVHDMGLGYCCDIFQPHFGSQFALNAARVQSFPQWLRHVRPWIESHMPRSYALDRLCRMQYTGDEKCFIAVSDKVAKDLVALHGVAKNRVATIYNGVDLNEFSIANRLEIREAARQSLGLGNNELAILIVAHHHRLKGVYQLIHAVRNLNAGGVHSRLIVVGGRGRFAATVPPRKDQQVIYIGSVHDVLPFYAAADIYAHPTFYDACSLVVLEAMACGLPVLTTACNGAAGVMTNGHDGIILDSPRDLSVLTQRLASLQDDDYRERMGAAARTTIERHSLHENLASVERLYFHRALQKRSAAA